MRGEFRGVTDHFSVLGIPRAPQVDAEVLKERFHRLGAAAHPDGGGADAAFATVNEAWQTLRTAAGCLRHFLELEHPDALAITAQTPPELGDLFMEIAGLQHAVRQFSARRAQLASPIGRALIEPERLRLVENVRSLSFQVAERTGAACAGVRAGANEPANLAHLLAHLVFLGKWEREVREMELALQFPGEHR